MKIAGFFLLVTGWLIAAAAAALLKSGWAATVFALAGAGVEVLGLVLVFRCHAVAGKEHQ
jgi:hypothetical protein